MNRTRRLAALATALLLLSPAVARAQWVTIGRAALKKVKQVTQKEQTGAPGYSVATVLLEAKAGKVFDVALKSARANEKLRVTKQVPEKGVLEFADGDRVVGVTVSQVDGKITQILIASTTKPGAPDETSLVAKAALRICKEMGVECTLAAPE